MKKVEKTTWLIDIQRVIFRNFFSLQPKFFRSRTSTRIYEVLIKQEQLCNIFWSFFSEVETQIEYQLKPDKLKIVEIKTSK